MSSLIRTTRAEMSNEGVGAQSPDDENPHHAEAADHCDPHAPDEEHETEQQKKARLEAAVRKYRATLRNEAESGNEGFSADYYRSHKPPHW